MHRIYLPLTLVALIAVPAFARDASIYGAKVSPKDYVGSRVVHSAGSSGVIDLGYARGVVKGNRFVVLRQFGEDYRRIGTFTVVSVTQKTAVGHSSNFRLVKSDVVVIAARELAIWHGRNEEATARTNELIARKRRRGYDTLATQLDRDDLLEATPGNTSRLKKWEKVLRETKPEGITYWDTTALRLQRREFVSSFAPSDELLQRIAEASGDVSRFVASPGASLIDNKLSDTSTEDEADSETSDEAAASEIHFEAIPETTYIARRIASDIVRK